MHSQHIKNLSLLAWADRLEDGFVGGGDPTSRILGYCILVLVPVVVAFTGVGYQLAQEISQDFSALSPLVFGSTINFCLCILLLLGKAGLPGLRGLFALRYATVAILGCAGGGRYILQLLALREMPSTLFFVIMKTSILWCAGFEVVHLHMLPSIMKTVAVLGVLVSCGAYVAKNMENAASGAQVPAGALALSFAAALSDALADTFTDMASMYFTRDMNKQERDAELTRFVIAEQFWKIIVYLAVICFLDGTWPNAIFWNNLFHSYTWGMAAYAIIPIILKFPVFQVSIFTSGAVITNMAGALDMTVAYFAELALGWTDFRVSDILTISTTAIILILSSLHTLEVQSSLAKAMHQVAHDVVEMVGNSEKK